MGISVKRGGTPSAPVATPEADAPPAPEPVTAWQTGHVQADSVGIAETLKWGVAKKTDRSHDGQLLGADGKFYAADTPLEQIPAVQPDNGREAKELIIEINGIMTPAALHARTAQALANSGASVIAIHNATEGMLADLDETVRDKLDIGKNPAVDTAARVIWDALAAGKTIHFAGHSQGALIICRALGDVKNRLMLEKGLTAGDVTKLFGRIKVETFGGSATRYLDGPQYVHYVNRWDLIPWMTGVGGSERHPFSYPGAGATVHVFSDLQTPHDLPSFAEGLVNLFARTVDRSIHGPIEVYYKGRRE